ncbi:hypothetical protein SUGI_1199700 [Cryptomeria japonica]|nr:hypothetical protein SUGI_1199700 [Cryptomeria japonica]
MLQPNDYTTLSYSSKHYSFYSTSLWVDGVLYCRMQWRNKTLVLVLRQKVGSGQWAVEGSLRSPQFTDKEDSDGNSPVLSPALPVSEFE